MTIELAGKKFILNSYFDGFCPGCLEFKAPITIRELIHLNNASKIHRGSTPRRVDPNAGYHREVWEECFNCPHCETFFAVPFSNV